MITPVIIYNIEAGMIVLSTHVDQFVRKILTINNLIGRFKSYHSEFEEALELVERNFILLSSEKIYFFQSNEFGIYDIKVHFLEDVTDEVGLITCGCAFLMNGKNPELRAYADETSEIMLLLTGHKDGKVLVWDYEEDFTYSRVLADYKHEIIEIIHLKSGVGIATEDSFIHLWDLFLKSPLKYIDLSNMPLKLYSLKLKNIVPAGNKIFFNTYEGDMIQLDLKLKKEWSKNSFICKYDARRIKNIIQLRKNLTSLTLIERVSKHN